LTLTRIVFMLASVSSTTSIPARAALAAFVESRSTFSALSVTCSIAALICWAIALA